MVSCDEDETTSTTTPDDDGDDYEIVTDCGSPETGLVSCDEDETITTIQQPVATVKVRSKLSTGSSNRRELPRTEHHWVCLLVGAYLAWSPVWCSGEGQVGRRGIQMILA